MKMRNLTKTELELLNRLKSILDDKDFVCGTTQDCYDDIGRQELLDYLNQTGETNKYRISFKAMQIGFKRKGITK